jgi:protein SCO1
MHNAQHASKASTNDTSNRRDELDTTVATRRAARRATLGGLGAGLVAAAGSALAAAPLPAVVERDPRAQRFPDVRLITHEGRPVRFYSDLVRNRIVLVNMSYTVCNNICPTVTRNLLRVQQALGDRVGRDIHMITLSVLPEQDTPAELAHYVALHGVRPGWTFLTGRREDLTRVRVSLGFYDRDPDVDADRAQHTGMVRIGNDRLDRWCMTPAQAEPHLIVEAVNAVDPVGRAARVGHRSSVAAFAR